MTKQEILTKAIEFATERHKGQVDKAGVDYITHPLRVMEGVDDLNAKIVAVLHDVMEDTDTTEEEIRELVQDEEIVQALLTLTRGEGEEYFEYINRVKKNPLAVKVKLSDLSDNLRPDRPGASEKLREKYRKAQSILVNM